MYAGSGSGAAAGEVTSVYGAMKRASAGLCGAAVGEAQGRRRWECGG